MSQREKRLPVYSQLIRRARREMGITSDVASQIVGVHPSTYINCENGRGSPAVIQNIDKLFPENAEEIREAWREFKGDEIPGQIDEVVLHEGSQLDIELIQGVSAAGLTRFFPSRQYYKTLRNGNDSISAYIQTAQVSVEMVSISLATGMELEGVIDAFYAILTRRAETAVTVSLLDYELKYLMKAIAPVVGASPDTLRLRIEDTVRNLEAFADERLPRYARDRFRIKCHNVIPNASAIILDGDLEGGVIQLETKGYKMGMYKSFGFECAAPSEFFIDLRDSYRHLIADGRKIA